MVEGPGRCKNMSTGAVAEVVPAVTNESALEAVRSALKTEVIAVLQSVIDVLRNLPPDQAYNHVMNNPAILDACFRLYRGRPEMFSKVVVDGNGALVTQDHVVLRCGRSLGDSIALIVRAASKRYFRANAEQVPGYESAKPKLAADALYDAMSEYLRYEWQCNLIPVYVRLPLTLVKTLGDKLLDFHEPCEITGMTENPEPPGSRRPPLLMDKAARLMSFGTNTLDPEVLWKVARQMNLARLFPDQDFKAVEVAVSHIAMSTPEALGLLMPLLGNDLRRFTVFLFVVYANAGPQRFKSLFHTGGQTYVIRRWMGRLKEQPMPRRTLASMQKIFGNVVEMGATSELDEHKLVKA